MRHFSQQPITYPVTQALLLMFMALALQFMPEFCFAAPFEEQGKSAFNDGWRFHLGDQKGAELVEFDDQQWESVSLPHNAHNEPLLVNHQWQGICWYRKQFEIPKSQRHMRVLIEFEGAMNCSKLWVNGHEAGGRQGGFLPLIVDITEFIRTDRANLVAVQLDNRDNPVTGPKPLKMLDFCTYGGLYRDAWLRLRPTVRITDSILGDTVGGGGVSIHFPKVDESLSVVSIKTQLKSDFSDSIDLEVVHEILDSDGNLVQSVRKPMVIDPCGNAQDVTEMNVKEARLWNPDEPNLYTLKTEILWGEKRTDYQCNRFGIREIRFEDGKCFINGKPTFLRGVNRHQEYPFIGYSLPDTASYRDAFKIKEAGFNLVRLSHYPQDPSFMNACDELGLLVLDAILGWQYYSEDPRFQQYCYQSAQTLIRRDRNHPCVLAWEVSLNETEMPISFMKTLHDIVKAECPDGRVYTCGWMNDIYDIFLQARQHRIIDPVQPREGQPLIVSEYGDWEYFSTNPGLNQHLYNQTLRTEKSSRQLRSYGEARMLQQAMNVQEAHNDNLSTVATGDAYWVMFDYNRGYDDTIEASGIMDIFRLPKFAYWFFQSQIPVEKQAVVKLATFWTEDSPLDVKVYSNCEKVELYLNGVLQSQQTPDEDVKSRNLLHPPFSFRLPEFQPGELEARGFINGKCVAVDKVNSPGEIQSLNLFLDDCGIEPIKGDIVFMRIVGVDENGTVNSHFSAPISLKKLEGATLLNTEEVRAEAGIASLLLRVEDPSALHVEVDSNGVGGGFIWN